MRNQLQGLWIAVRSGFWFIPSLMVLGAAGLAALMVWLDGSWSGRLMARYPGLFGSSAQGAREILAAIAASMITIAGVTFSITIVALSLASNQYTPRIPRNFMRDRGNQTVLGVFVSIFVYCVLVLRTIRGGEEAFIPSFSLLTGIALGVVGVGFLIYFIHHISTSIQAAAILSRIYGETVNVIRSIYPEKMERDEPRPEQEAPPPDDWGRLRAPRTGYIQTVDIDGLVDWADCQDCVIRMERGIGDFVIEGTPLLAISRPLPAENDHKTVHRFFTIADYRTIDQDPLFGVRQMTDMALKALSPAINDPTTASNCLDYIAALMHEITRRRLPPPACMKNGNPRVIARRPDYQDFADEAFHEIRQNARDNVAMYLRLLRAIGRVPREGLTPARLRILLEHAKLIQEQAAHHIQLPHDLRVIAEDYNRVRNYLEGAEARE